MANSPATVVSIEEVGGTFAVYLAKRALPYRPVTFGGKQRVEFTWYPGSPIATAQVLGPEESPFTLRGFWKDRFIVGTNDALITTPDFFGTIDTATLIGTLDKMRRRGQLCMFSWDNLVRQGHITSFQQTWHNAHDCEWELEFSPISQGESLSPPPTQVPQLSDASAKWQDAERYVTNSIGILVGSQNPPPFGIEDNILLGLEVLNEQVLIYTNAVQNTVTSVVSSVLAGPDAVNRLSAIADGMKQTATGLFTTICDQADESLFPALGEEGLGIAPDDALTLSEAIQAAVYKTAVKDSVRGLRDYAVSTQADYDGVLNPQLLQTFLATQDVDLRDVSIQFYGNANYWRTLMQFNRLGTSKLRAGELVFVPQLGNSGDGIAVPGAQA